MIILRVEELSYRAGEKLILSGINVRFSKGKIYSILGNNGAGKSTFGKIVMGLNGYGDNHSGRIFFDQKEITGESVTERAKLGIGFTFQEPVRFKGISVRRYLSITNEPKPTEQNLEEALDIVGLNKNYLFRKVDHSLSGGERKRMELASVFLQRPKLVIFDEPDSGIDMMSNTVLKHIFNALMKGGSTIISITHREEISMLADEAILLCHGKIMAMGKPTEVNDIYKSNCDTCNHINEPDRDWGRE